jgi:succinate-semialdehyde dehydrogenase/glutarate-semialdehyde dehydrogenase
VLDRADGIAFNGSTPRGRQVAARCGERLIPALIELGGKNAVVVLDDVDIAGAVEITLRTSYADAGQTCVSAERLYVHEAIAERFTDALARAAARMRVGRLDDPDCEVGSLMDAAVLDRVCRHVNDAVAKGARLLAGGRVRPDLGPFVYEPTVLTDVPDHARCDRAETFGPVLAVYPVADADEAVAAVNDSEFGLHHVVLGRDTEAAVAVANRLRAGTVSVNDGYILSWAATDAPVGGWGSSGLGRRHGEIGLITWTRGRAVAVGRRLPLAAPGVRPRALQTALTTGLRTLRRSGRR